MKNETGIYPVEYKCLVSPVEVAEKSKGGIIIPDEKKDRDQFAQMEGVLVAASPHAFSYENWTVAPDQKPQPGNRVLFARYAGAMVDGKDGKKYRLVNDKDIAAVLA